MFARNDQDKFLNEFHECRNRQNKYDTILCIILEMYFLGGAAHEIDLNDYNT